MLLYSRIQPALLNVGTNLPLLHPADGVHYFRRRWACFAARPGRSRSGTIANARLIGSAAHPSFPLIHLPHSNCRLHGVGMSPSHSFDAKDQARPPRWRRRTPCWLHALSGSLTHAEQVHHVLSPCVQSLTSDGMPSKTLAAATALVYRPPSLLTPAGGACPGTATTAYALLG